MKRALKFSNGMAVVAALQNRVDPKKARSERVAHVQNNAEVKMSVMAWIYVRFRCIDEGRMNTRAHKWGRTGVAGTGAVAAPDECGITTP